MKNNSYQEALQAGLSSDGMQLSHWISLAVAIVGGGLMVLYYEMPNPTGCTFMHTPSESHAVGLAAGLAAIARNGI
jgi:hypothetical protein